MLHFLPSILLARRAKMTKSTLRTTLASLRVDKGTWLAVPNFMTNRTERSTGWLQLWTNLWMAIAQKCCFWHRVMNSWDHWWHRLHWHRMHRHQRLLWKTVLRVTCSCLCCMCMHHIGFWHRRPLPTSGRGHWWSNWGSRSRAEGRWAQRSSGEDRTFGRYYREWGCARFRHGWIGRICIGLTPS